MRSKMLCFVVLATLVLASSGQKSNNTDKEACGLWKHMAEQLSHQRASQMQCYANSTDPCTSLDCVGTYKYMSPLLNMEHGSLEVDYCFGMTLNHCDNPVSIDIYLQVPKKKVKYYRRVSHDTQLQVPGLTFPYEGLGTIDVFLHFHMVRKGNKLTLSIICKLRISTALGTSFWPERMQTVIVPPEEMLVPACDAIRGTSPAYTFKPCIPPHWVQPHTSHITTPSPVLTPIPKSLTYNQPCTQGKDVCSRWEMCQPPNCTCQPEYAFRNGRCASPTRYGAVCKVNSDCARRFHEICSAAQNCSCAEGYEFHPYYQLCKFTWTDGHAGYLPAVRKSTVAAPHRSVSVKTPDNSHNVAIIAGSVTGGVVLLAAVFLIVFFMRKRRRPYQNRELLLSSNDDTDVIM